MVIYILIRRTLVTLGIIRSRKLESFLWLAAICLMAFVMFSFIGVDGFGLFSNEDMKVGMKPFWLSILFISLPAPFLFVCILGFIVDPEDMNRRLNNKRI